jgi:hypothetical protein
VLQQEGEVRRDCRSEREDQSEDHEKRLPD